MSTHEQWRDIPGMVGFYQASSLGRIRSVSRNRRGFRGSVVFCPGRVVSLFPVGQSGYLRFNASLGGPAKSMAVHRGVALAFVDNAKRKPFVNHKDSNRTNNAASNLEWVTNRENCIHASMAGRLPRGSTHPLAVLTEVAVSEMRQRHKLGEKISTLANEYGVSAHAAGKAINRDTWRHVA